MKNNYNGNMKESNNENNHRKCENYNQQYNKSAKIVITKRELE